ncbi:MAG: proteasome assembly chaperone family protein [Candidatus Altiarchaeales archaeon]|nr:MAG: proteasome assembly chaperone family protein [Candidatus Altiarchaeales archaeon]RLI94824.1 MAG: proteasome assembly chaperone family protein [Candidatus Altiarchaeales archaeon]
MDYVIVKILEEPKLKNPILIEGLPGIGLVGKLAVDHMLDELKAKKFIEMYSPFLPPQVSILEDGTVKLVNMEFYYWIGEKNDLILLVGDFQGITPDSQYQLAEKTLDIAEKFNVMRIFTLGGFGTGGITKRPRVFGAATNRRLVEELRKYGIIFKGGGAIFGASGLLLGLGMQRDIEGVCLMGETHGQIIDAKSAEAVLRVLTRILDIDIDMTELAEKAKETEHQMSRMSKIISEQKKAIERQQEFMEERPSYIR